MAISNATRLSDFGSGIGTQGAVIKVDNVNKRVGIGTTNPGGGGNGDATLQVGEHITFGAGGNAKFAGTGIVTATAFYGDGANLDNVAAAGFGTPMSDDQDTIGYFIFKTPQTYNMTGVSSVFINSDVSSGMMAYTRLNEIIVGTSATIHIGAGTTLIMDVLNIFAGR
tara:strand:- start:621 stop:1124 length:504 start_codon:yes stop_codon:yes gene_type:complete